MMNKIINNEDGLILSVVIALHNESSIIGSVLESIEISVQEYLNMTELIIIDNDCSDDTISIADLYLKKKQLKYRIIKNYSSNTASGFNIGIRNSDSKYVMIMGGHTLLDKKYFSVLFSKFSVSGEWDCIGGRHEMITFNYKERLIESLLTSPFGVGDSKFRTSSKPGYVDTVPYGTYKREIFNKYGLFDESYVRNQDLEYNLRIKERGVNIFYDPRLKTYYKYLDKASIYQFYKKYFNNGKWIGIKLFQKGSWQIRHLIPLVFVLIISFGLLASIYYPFFIYLIVGILMFHLLVGASLSLISMKGVQILLLPIFYLIFHITYGIGTICGIVLYKQ